MLKEIRERRRDLTLAGCDISRAYISFARRKGGGIHYYVGDAAKWPCTLRPDLITATAGLHHLSWKQQAGFIKKVEGELKPGGLFIVGEEVLPRHRGKYSREKGVVDFYSEMLPRILHRKVSRDVIRASLDVFANDLLVRGEFKRDLITWNAMLAREFKIVKVKRIWPHRERGFGDFLIVARRKP
jgi:predicted TPR repeat methyltransferase